MVIDPQEFTRLDPQAKRQLLATLLERKSREKQYPASFTQEALWFLNRLNPIQTTFSRFPDVRLRGPLRVDIVELVLNEILRRHEILRTRFPERDGSPVQVVEPFEPRTFPLIDLSHLPDDEKRRETQRLSLEQPAIDLRQDPVIGVRLVRWGPEDHVLLFHVHHIIFDGWSVGVAFRELVTLYQAFAAGQPSPLPDLPLQYGDFAIWQRRYLRGEKLQRLEEYWVQRLKGLQPLDLPIDHPRPPVRTTQAASIQLSLSPHLNRRVFDFAQREGVTLYMVLLAAFSEILHRFTGVMDIAVGSPVANRRRREFEPLIGYFINMLVMRNDLSGDPSFVNLVKRVQQTTVESLEYQDLTLDRVVKIFAPPRDLSRHPLFQVMFVLQNTPRSHQKMGQLCVEQVPWTQATSATIFDLTMVWNLENGHLRGRLIYNSDLFERPSAIRIVNHYLRLLEEALNDPDRPLSAISSLGSEKAWLERIGRGTQHEITTLAPSVPHQFRAGVLSHPHAIAVEEGNRCLTYSQLDAWSDHFALALCERGAGPGVRVAVLLPRRLETIVVLLGILKARAAYIPLDPGLPENRIRAILADSSPRVLVTTEDTAAQVQQLDCVLLRLRLGSAIPDLHTDRRYDLFAKFGDPEPGAPAYLIYTSGSTGIPKGVPIHHAALLTYCVAAIATYALRTTDRMLQFSALSFDAHVEEIFPTLLSGGTLVLRDETMLESLNAFSLGCGSRAISVASLPTGFWNEWTRAIESGNAAVPKGLRMVILGGEALVPDRLRIWFEMTQGSIRLFNSYGPTETTVVATATELNSGHGRDYRVPIGRPLPGVMVKVVDAFGRLSPVGVPGELLIGGKTLSTGYMGPDNLSPKAFFIDPADGERWYRSGDRVRWRADDMLEFIGRIDGQLKIRGFRVEPAEVEAAILQHPMVERVSVVPYETDGGVRIAAYLAVGSNGLETDELRAFLKRRVPDFMIPARFIAMTALPVNSSGKVVREKLPKLTPVSQKEPDQTSSSNDYELRVIEVWKQILGVERIERGDDFFDLGGDSLSALRLVVEVKKQFGVELSLGSVLSDSSLSSMAAHIEALLQVRPLNQVPPIQKSPERTVFPLSFVQEELCAKNQIDSYAEALKNQARIQISGPLNREALALSIQETLKRHDILRTKFIEKDGIPCQEVTTGTELDLRYEDLSLLDPISKQKALEELYRHELVKPFDSSSCPPLRMLLLRIVRDEHVLLLTVHPILLDTWSLSILFQEVGAIYAAFSRSQMSALRKPAIQFGDYALWQRKIIRDEYLDQLLEYWQWRLKKITPPTLLTDRPRPEAVLRDSLQHHFIIEPQLAIRIKAESKRNNISPFVLLLTALNLLLHHNTRATDIAIGVVLSGRGRNDLAHSVGSYANVVVMQTDFSCFSGLEDAWKRVKNTVHEALIYQDLPISLLEQKMRTMQEDDCLPLYRVTFNFIDDAEEFLDAGGTRFAFKVMKSALPHRQEPDFAMTVFPTKNTFLVEIRYHAELYDPSSIVRFSEQWLSYLQHLLLNSSLAIDNDVTSICNEYEILPDPVRRSPMDLEHGLQKERNTSVYSEQRIWLLSKNNRGTPVFFLYGLGGMVTPYRLLSRYLAPRTVYGIEALGLRAKTSPESSITEMAKTALSALREIQPKGPYIIAGWSMGGWIATEMARILNNDGEEIIFLGLFDSPLIGKLNIKDFRAYGLADRAKAGFAKNWSRASENRLLKKLMGYESDGRTDDGLAERIRTIIDSHHRAMDDYIPSVYRGTVVYWKAESRSLSPIWRKLFPEMRIENAQGNHFSMLREPAVFTLASSVEKILATL